MRKLCLLAIVSISVSSLHAQKVDEKLKAEAIQLKTVFKDASIAALKSTTVYNFSVNDAEKTLSAKCQESFEFVALKPNTVFTIRNFFDDTSSIDSYSLKTDAGRTLLHDKFCGHYQSGDIFYSDAQICAYHFGLGLVGQGARFESTMVYKDSKYLPQIFFHDEAPTKKREISIHVPDWAQVELIEMNFEGYNISKKKIQANGITSYVFTAENLEGMPTDKNLPGYLHFMPHILILSKSFESKGKKTTILSSTDDLYKWYSAITSKVNKNYEELKPIVTTLTGSLKTNEEKIKAIYYWVQDNIKYIAFEDGIAGFKPEDAHQVFYKRYGDCKGMANLTKAMLTVAGFDARLTWIGTNRIPYTYAFPSLAVDNHMICAVFDNNKQYILDPTDKFNPMGTNGESIQGKQALVENKEGYTISTVSVEPIEKYLQESAWKYQIVDNVLQGTGNTTVQGEHKKMILNYNSLLKKDDFDKFLKSVVAGAGNPDDFNLKTYTDFDRDKPWSISYDMNLKNQVFANNKEIYLDLDFVDDYKGTKLEKTRKVPYKFSSRVYKKIYAELQIPAGYKLEHLPDAFRIENAYYSFDMKYAVEKNTVVYTKEIKIFNNTLPVSEFANWNKAIDSMNKFYDDQIILKSNE